VQVLVAMTTTLAGSHAQNNYTFPSVIHIGLLQPLEGPLGFEKTGMMKGRSKDHSALR